MKSDLTVWIDSVGTDTERGIAALHDPGQRPGGSPGHCPTCTVADELPDDWFTQPVAAGQRSPAPAPCATARLIAWGHRHEPGFRPDWAPTTGAPA